MQPHTGANGTVLVKCFLSNGARYGVIQHSACFDNDSFVWNELDGERSYLWVLFDFVVAFFILHSEKKAPDSRKIGHLHCWSRSEVRV